MKNSKTIGLVIPCYKTSNSIIKVIETLPDFIDYIIIVDDKCPEKSGQIVEKLNHNKIKVIYNEKNEGVGGATIKGLELALINKIDIMIKIDGDGQMPQEYIYPLIEPIINNECDYSKGNRFYFSNELNSMPKIRLFGNSFLSFLVKFSSGYWNVSDPTNGFIALSNNALQLINLKRINKGYFFEINMLIEANLKNIVINEINMPSKYDNEKSSLNVYKVILNFPPLLFRGFIKRILYKYFIYDFNFGSVYLITGLPLFIFGFIFAIYNWMKYSSLNMFTPNGTITISLLSIIMGFQLLLQAITYDVLSSSPKRFK